MQAPIAVAKSAIQSTPLALRKQVIAPEQEVLSTSSNESPAVDAPTIRGDAQKVIEESKSHVAHLRIRLPRMSISANAFRQLAIVVTAMAVFMVGGYAIAQRKPSPLPKAVVLGEWLVASADSAECLCGLALKSDGKCVVFNAGGVCWTGRFQWIPRADDGRGLRGLDTTIELDQASIKHQIQPVATNDGYLIFIGEGDALPIIDGHVVGDAFVRMDGTQLRLGYPVSMAITDQSKQLNAAWIVLGRQDTAIKKSRLDDFIIDKLPSPEKLLSLYGVPDEARPVQPYEIPRDKFADRYAGAQLVRYGNVRFAMTRTESWQPVIARALSGPAR